MPKLQYEPSTQEWFNEFVHGNISPTDAVLTPVERRILPSFNSPFHSSDRFPSWIHADCGLGFEYETSAIFGRRLALWLRSEPTANTNGKRWRKFMKIGGGINWFAGNSTPHLRGNGGDTTSLRTGVFGDLSKNNSKLNDWFAGVSFLNNSTNTDFVRERNDSGKWQIAFQTGTHHSSRQPDQVLHTALAFVHWNYAVPWWLGGTLIPKKEKRHNNNNNNNHGMINNNNNNNNQPIKNCNDKNGAKNNSNTIISWYASASYQQDPSFVMVRVNASVPVSPFSELSVGTDPLRRFHAALCTQLHRYVDFGMRVRLNTISWQDAGIDVGAMINASALMRGGRPRLLPDDFSSPSVRIGIQSVVGDNLLVFADIFRSNDSPSSSSSSSSSWFWSIVKSVQVGVGLSKINGDGGSTGSSGKRFFSNFFGNNNYRIGWDTFIKIEF